jgi:hypothetical protein
MSNPNNGGTIIPYSTLNNIMAYKSIQPIKPKDRSSRNSKICKPGLKTPRE